ncbi:hypothetical protein [Ensifer aridi]|uniref:hypothetical protein n=1 Tax=Ensifer aridi TaxID=1708715 RepID=UPI001FCCD6DA|nr:hypothetical protein [Ensifer aridi]
MYIDRDVTYRARLHRWEKKPEVSAAHRVIWDNISDRQTAFAALQSGEVDLL